ncbi:teichoic acid ABC transporter permease [Bacillus sp. LL01]|uniref:ABC transporter permease n=1 Tax=Bacillus sp. LL01 TaxID=1665556 RepID=UPI00064D4424|nr:ABC transporter permease [Bacillus sp. LL01]KMJ59297.1 teichoic acid ABC transporter permease [Bacillus sp. LL01]
MQHAFTIVKEQVLNFYLARRLSLYEMKSSNNNNYLGFLWEIINPLILISIYWFVFGFGIFRDRGNIEVAGADVPFLPWMLSGFVVWFFISPSILEGSKSIYTRIKIISKMNFPISVIPTYVVLSKLYQHFAMLIIIFILLHLFGYPVNIYYLQLPYFIISTVIFLIILTLLTSTLTAIVRDIQMVIQSFVRILIYLTPFLWPPYNLKPEIIPILMKLNPFYYLAEGYRYSLLGIAWYPIENWQYSLYFWGIALILLIIGSTLHIKFRDRFVDFL